MGSSRTLVLVRDTRRPSTSTTWCLVLRSFSAKGNPTTALLRVLNAPLSHLGADVASRARQPGLTTPGRHL